MATHEDFKHIIDASFNVSELHDIEAELGKQFELIDPSKDWRAAELNKYFPHIDESSRLVSFMLMLHRNARSDSEAQKLDQEAPDSNTSIDSGMAPIAPTVAMECWYTAGAMYDDITARLQHQKEPANPPLPYQTILQEISGSYKEDAASLQDWSDEEKAELCTVIDTLTNLYDQESDLHFSNL